MTELSQAALVALSRWIDAGNEQRDPEALTLHRLVKITEEAGEVVAATIGALGANPRKGVTNTFEAVLEELLDVAITALGAYEHIDGHQGRALSELDGKIVRVAERAGVAHPSHPSYPSRPSAPMLLCPECRDGKCRNCIGEALSDADELVPCECTKHPDGGLS